MLEFGIVNFWVYVLGAFAVIIAPGPNSLFVLKTAVTEGRRPALAGALAVLVGDSVLITCSFVGVAAMLAAHPDLFMWVRTAGGLYLAWLGFKILYSVYGKKKTAAGEDRETVRNSAEKRSAGAFKAFRTALILSLTNPKAILFFVAFFVKIYVCPFTVLCGSFFYIPPRIPVPPRFFQLFLNPRPNFPRRPETPPSSPNSPPVFF